MSNTMKSALRDLTHGPNAFLKREGKRGHLSYDPALHDRYRRTLAYVYLEDGTFVNAELIKQGYAVAYTKFPFTYLEPFR